MAEQRGDVMVMSTAACSWSGMGKPWPLSTLTHRMRSKISSQKQLWNTTSSHHSLMTKRIKCSIEAEWTRGMDRSEVSSPPPPPPHPRQQKHSGTHWTLRCKPKPVEGTTSINGIGEGPPLVTCSVGIKARPLLENLN